MSIQRPGEEERRIADLAAELERLGPEEIADNAAALVRHVQQHPRTPRNRVFALWSAIVEREADELPGATQLLASRGLPDFTADLAKVWARVRPARGAQLVEALLEAAGDEDDDQLAAGLRALAVEKKAKTAAERLVMMLTVALSASDTDAIAAAVKAIAAYRQPIRVPAAVQKELASELGQFATPREVDSLCLVGTIVGKLNLQGVLLERVLAQTIPGAQITKNDGVLASLLQLVPKKVTWEILAYNLACNAAVKNDKPRLLEWAKRARALGKKKERFLADADFAAFTKDPEFLAALA